MHDNGIHTDAEMHLCELEDEYHEAVRFLIPECKNGNITENQLATMVQPQFDEWFDARTGADWSEQ